MYISISGEVGKYCSELLYLCTLKGVSQDHGGVSLINFLLLLSTNEKYRSPNRYLDRPVDNSCNKFDTDLESDSYEIPFEKALTIYLDNTYEILIQYSGKKLSLSRSRFNLSSVEYSD